MKAISYIIFLFFISLTFVFFTGKCNALDLYSSFGTEADTLGDGVQEFADKLEGISNFKINIKSPEDIGVGQSELLGKVADGTIDMAIVLMVTQDRGNDDLNTEIDLYGEGFPFGLQMEEYLSWHYNGGGLTLVEDILKNDGDGVVVVPVIASTGQSGGMFIGEINKERFETGFKMRSFGLGQTVLRKTYPNMEFIAAVPGSTAVSDVLDGFADDLQGAEFTNPQIDQKSFLIDPDPNVQEMGVTHYYITAWQTPVTLHYLLINKKLFDRFNKKKQNSIKTAALASTQESYSRLLKRQGEALKEIEDMGIIISEFPEDVLSDLLAPSEQVLNETASANARFDEVLDSIKEYVRKQRAWLNDGRIDRDFRFENWSSDWESDVDVEK